MYRPLVVTVPPVALHPTLVLLVPDTEAANCCALRFEYSRCTEKPKSTPEGVARPRSSKKPTSWNPLHWSQLRCNYLPWREHVQATRRDRSTGGFPRDACVARPKHRGRELLLSSGLNIRRYGETEIDT